MGCTLAQLTGASKASSSTQLPFGSPNQLPLPHPSRACGTKFNINVVPILQGGLTLPDHKPAQDPSQG